MNIFEIENGAVKININCLLIPELKRIYEAYDDPLPVFAFLHFVTHPDSSYMRLDDDVIEEEVYKDYPGEYTPNDQLVAEARLKLEKLFMTPTEKYFRSLKHGLEKLGNYVDTVIISDSKEFGNIQYVQKALNEAGKTIESFKKLEKQRDDERKKGRGNKQESWDI